ncbi:benzaldehyde dehydrogenase [Pseudomonas sp. zbq_4]|uniref:benzaldehyde dehydrogenase n=1 Tax=Pseudomonas TaxID=286 RepID=UPI00370AAECB
MSSLEQMLPMELWNGRLFTGQWFSSGANRPVLEPATGCELGSVAIADAQVVSESVKSAKVAQCTWHQMPYDNRAEILRKAVTVGETYREEIVEWIVRESGSTRAKAEFELSVSLKSLQEAAALPGRSQGEVLPARAGRLSIARRRPLGVVGVISPFNFPLYLAMRAVAPALAVGNSVVLKPDPRTAVCGGLIIARIFELAGLPSGVLHVLPGEGDAGAALVSAPEVAMIQFTGSTSAGRKVGEAAGKHLKKVSLELGGKNSLIILDDADIDVAVSNAVWGSYLHQGQICMATGRILVQRGIYDKFLTRLVEKAKSMKVGDPSKENVHLGPIINQQQIDNIKRIVRAAVEAGAKLEVGGSHESLFFQATVLSNVSNCNPAFKEEIFGPVAVVIPFDKDDDACVMANDTEYGLSAGVITSNVGRAMKMADSINTGILHINDQTVNDEVVNPFGGTGASGNGSSVGGAANWEEYTQWQWLTVQSEAPLYPL